MITEVYDVKKDSILAVSHWAHGYEMRYDLQDSHSICTQDNDKQVGTELTCRGENNKYSDFNILTVSPSGAHQDEPWKAQNNQVSFVREPSTNTFTHPVVFVENGTHEFWPSSKWGAEFAPNHNGDDNFNFYLTKNIPNLGEIQRPMSEEAAVIIGFNGYWGNWNHDNDVSPGPSLHAAWNWYLSDRRAPIAPADAER